MIFCTHNDDVFHCRYCVPPEGSHHAQITIIGARPGPDELAARRPFIGWSGDLLFRLLAIPRESCYITNVRKDYSKINSVPTEREIHEVLESLRDEISQTNSNIIIALGGQALYALTGKSSIDLWRGSILVSSLLPGRKLLATWHPAAAARVYSHRFIIAKDLRRALRESAYPDIHRPKHNFILSAGIEDLDTIRHLGPVVTVDIETRITRRLDCLALSDSHDRAICINLLDRRRKAAELAIILREVDRVLRTRRIRGQNIQFDTSRLEAFGFTIGCIDHDTMLSHHLLWTELGRPTVRKGSKEKAGVDDLAGKHKLEFITSIYTEEPYYKDESDKAWESPSLSFEERLERYATYNCKDAATTHESSCGLERELVKYKQKEYYDEHVLGLIRPIMRIQDRGLEVDFSELNRVRKRTQLEANFLQAKLDRAVGFACNVRSTTDMRYLIYEKLGYKIKKTTSKKEAPSVDEDTILEFAYKSPHANLFRLILDIRKRRTLSSGFLGLEVGNDGRYHASYLIHGTDSGRLSSRAVGKGPQLQNIPKSTRKIFKAADEHIFISGDYKRAEAMYVAYDSGDSYLIPIFQDPSRDLYLESASESLSLNLEDAKPYRTCFKHVELATNYGLGPKKLITVLRTVADPPIYIEDIPIRGISSAESKAKYLIESRHARSPGIRQWQNRIRDLVSHGRTLYSSLGRRRVFLGRMDEKLFGAAYSYRPQASVVGLTNRALRVLDAQGYTLVAQTHDEILIEAPIDACDRTGQALIEAMEFEIEVFDGRKLIIPIELKVGWSWGEMNDWSERAQLLEGRILPRSLPRVHERPRVA